MTVHLVTFSDESMSRAAQLCIESAARAGGVDDSLRWYYQDFRLTDCYAKNYNLLSQSRGLGHWAWKPQIVDWAMRGLMTNRQFIENSFCPPKDGDILIYADAGVEFIAPVSHIIERMDQDIFLFGNNWEHAHWCKRDVVEAIWPREQGIPDSYMNDSFLFWSRFNQRNGGKQAQASVIFFRVSDYTRAFVKEWLDWCLFEGGRLIDDSPSRLPNHPEFQEHRHDQAILTTMAYREGIKLHYWPAVYNKGGSPEFVYEKLPEYAGDSYPVLFSHHRKRNHEWSNAA